jgi:SAM-dependent methyltransferase
MYKNLENCVCCQSSNLAETLSLGLQPLANYYRESPSEDLPKAPLVLNTCHDCWHSQLSCSVKPELLFSDYSYASGTSGALSGYFEWFAGRLADGFHEDSLILDIAANDGSQLVALQDAGFRRIEGIDPARNLVASVCASLNVQVGFWPENSDNVSDNLQVVVCQNVLAHVPEPLAFLKEVERKLADDGVIFIQPSQVRMFELGQFDTIYHEHISFFNTNSMAELARRSDLKLVDEVIVKVHGDSPIFVLQKLNAPTKDFGFLRQGSFYCPEDLKQYELRTELYSSLCYNRFSSNAKELIGSLNQTVAHWRKSGGKVAFVGAAAKAMVVANALTEKPDYILDESTYKIGRYAPCQNLQVLPLADAATLSGDVLFVISAWNFFDGLVEKIKAVRNCKSVFYRYFPTLERIEA